MKNDNESSALKLCQKHTDVKWPGTASRLCVFHLVDHVPARSQVYTVVVDDAAILQRCGIEFGARDGVNVHEIHLINLLERPVLGLNHEEVNDKEQRKATSAEDEAVEVVNLVRDHGREEGNQEVEEPVAGCCKGHAGCTVSSRVL